MMPTPSPVASIPTAIGTTRGGNVARNMAYATAGSAQMSAWSPRPISSTGSVVAVAHTTEPSTYAAAMPSSTRFALNRLARLPAIGCVVPPTNSRMVMTQLRFGL